MVGFFTIGHLFGEGYFSCLDQNFQESILGNSYETCCWRGGKKTQNLDKHFKPANWWVRETTEAVDHATSKLMKKTVWVWGGAILEVEAGKSQVRGLLRLHSHILSKKKERKRERERRKRCSKPKLKTKIRPNSWLIFTCSVLLFLIANNTKNILKARKGRAC